MYNIHGIFDLDKIFEDKYCTECNTEQITNSNYCWKCTKRLIIK